ncbi:MAG: uroporphyrinogen decarboxylase family protein [Spirochaetales bacterium]|nr:uroporphyrinogen decarboxylase family protein [Spirochaetales bacterium]MCF7938159.1 uroporphyrinogen decarboxylase family protein [Spirochaetales bacterium]
MSTMSSKERVITAMNRQVPDRVPAVLWGSYYTLNDDTYFNTLKYLGIDKPMPPFRRKKPRNSNYYDDRVLDAFDTDARYIWSGFTDIGGARMDGDMKDAWGVEWKRMGPHVTSVNPPLQGLSADQIENFEWPDPEKYLDFDLMADRISWLKKTYPDKAIGARAVNSYGPFEQASVLRGREDFYVEMLTEPEISKLIIDKCTDVIIRTQEIYLDKVGKDVDFFEIPGDDYGGTDDIMISPNSFEDMFKPALARIVQNVKDFRSDLPVAFHSDGAITKIIGSLAEIGVDVLNPLEPLPSMDWPQVKKDFGDRMAFMGGVDLKQALTGSADDVKADVQRCIETFGEGGGYVLTSANHMQSDIPPENIQTMFEAVKEFGRY